MTDCEYPHRVTFALTDEAYKELDQETGLRNMMGDISPVSMGDLILVYLVNSIQTNDSTFAIHLRGIKEIRESKEE